MAQMLVNDDFEIGLVGRWTPETESEVRREAIVAYAEAIGETDARLLSGEAAPLLFGVVPSWRQLVEVFTRVIPEIGHPRQVHGEHTIDSPRPLRPGDVLRTRARVLAIKPVSSGTVVAVEAESRSPEGELLVHQVSTGFVIGITSTTAAGELPSPPDVTTAGSAEIVEIATDTGLPARYAAASGDHSAIHLDDSAARAIGLPGVILHGMCSLALAGRAVVTAAAGGDPTLLRSLACRFKDVALPGQSLMVSVSGSGSEVRFTATDAGGRVVLASGRSAIGAPFPVAE
jgi:acyl dehydratase